MSHFLEGYNGRPVEDFTFLSAEEGWSVHLYSCRTCGALVNDTSTHETWHAGEAVGS